MTDPTNYQEDVLPPPPPPDDGQEAVVVVEAQKEPSSVENLVDGAAVPNVKRKHKKTIDRTPAAVIQEFLGKRHIIPYYELSQIRCGYRRTIFQAEVSFYDLGRRFIAIGNGSSKKQAKHESATAMLEQLHQLFPYGLPCIIKKDNFTFTGVSIVPTIPRDKAHPKATNGNTLAGSMKKKKGKNENAASSEGECNGKQSKGVARNYVENNGAERTYVENNGAEVSYVENNGAERNYVENNRAEINYVGNNGADGHYVAFKKAERNYAGNNVGDSHYVENNDVRNYVENNRAERIYVGNNVADGHYVENNDVRNYLENNNVMRNYVENNNGLRNYVENNNGLRNYVENNNVVRSFSVNNYRNNVSMQNNYGEHINFLNNVNMYMDKNGNPILAQNVYESGNFISSNNIVAYINDAMIGNAQWNEVGGFKISYSNPIGILQEVCAQQHWDSPKYEFVTEIGPPHNRIFTISCKLFNFREAGSGKNKKVAKRLAAHKMLIRLQKNNFIPENTDTLWGLNNSYGDDSGFH